MKGSGGRAKPRIGDIAWAAIFCGISAMLLVPESREAFAILTAAHPYLLGFLKFSVMASMGELLAIRILEGEWRRQAGFLAKALAWGLAGMAIVLMFALFSDGVEGLVVRKLLFVGAGFPARALSAFFVSALMNSTFGIVLMGAHRVCDTLIDLRMRKRLATLNDALAEVDWPDFIHFVVGRTIPFFWIPAHTLTFMLPSEYRVISAAYLSIALGLALTYARKRKAVAG
jgi:hypothetical protein